MIVLPKVMGSPYQVTNGIFHKIRTKRKFILHMETAKSLNNQSNLEKEKMELQESGLPDFRLY